MKKEEFIEQYGKAAWEKKLAQNLTKYRTNPEKIIAQAKAWNKANPEKREEIRKQRDRKGGRHYERHLKYMRTGLQGERNIIRATHGKYWRRYKNIIAPDSQIHHQWRLNSAGYDGVALVEADQHMHGIIKVIRILDGKITLLTEEEVQERIK